MDEEETPWLAWEPIEGPLSGVLVRCSLCMALCVDGADDRAGHERFHEDLAVVSLAAGVVSMAALDARRHAMGRLRRSV